MMTKFTRWTELSYPLPGGIVRILWAWFFTIILFFSLTLGESTSAFAPVDHHSPTSAGSYDSHASSTEISQSCHQVLACTALVLPIGSTAAFFSDNAVRLQPNLAQSQLRFSGPSVSLPPPRLLV